MVALPLSVILDDPARVYQGDIMSRAHLTPKRFRELREGLGMTQVELAQWGDVTDRTIKRFESGDQPVPKVWKVALEALAKGKA